MRVIKGTHRIALVFERFGIVLKFPNIDWQWAWDDSRPFLQHEGIRGFRYLTFDPGGILYEPVSQGIMENWYEHRFYRRTRYPFLLPTYFSFFGLVNIQRLGLPCGMSDMEVYRAFLGIAGMDDLMRDPHHFLNAGNFCRHPITGQFMVLDYGGLECRKILSDHADRILLCLPDALRKVGSSYWEGRS